MEKTQNSKNSNTDIPINQHQSTINTHCPPLVSMILLIDSYDSFTNNLAHLLKESTGQEVITIHNDSFKPIEYETFIPNIFHCFNS